MSGTGLSPSASVMLSMSTSEQQAQVKAYYNERVRAETTRSHGGDILGARVKISGPETFDISLSNVVYCKMAKTFLHTVRFLSKAAPAHPSPGENAGCLQYLKVD